MLASTDPTARPVCDRLPHWLLLASVAVGVAALLAATDDVDVNPNFLAALVAVTYGAGLLALGAIWGRWGALAFAIAYLAADLIEGAFLTSGTDGSESFGTALFLLPFALLAIAAGALARGIAGRVKPQK